MLDKDYLMKMEASINDYLEGKVKFITVLDLLSSNKGNQN